MKRICFQVADLGTLAHHGGVTKDPVHADGAVPSLDGHCRPGAQLPGLSKLDGSWALHHQQKWPDNELPHYLADCHSPQPPSATSPVTWHVPIPGCLEPAPSILCLHPAPVGGRGPGCAHPQEVLELSVCPRQVTAIPAHNLKGTWGASPVSVPPFLFPTRAATLPRASRSGLKTPVAQPSLQVWAQHRRWHMGVREGLLEKPFPLSWCLPSVPPEGQDVGSAAAVLWPRG